MICNKFHDAASMAASDGTRASSAAADRGTPREQAELKLYVSHDGHTLIIPAPNVFSCIIEAGKYFKNGKSKITTHTTSLIPSCVAILEIELPITHKEPWCVDTRAVRIPSTGGRILTHRPIFNDWRLSFTVDLDVLEMSPKLFRQIMDAAGSKVGLGDFRPARKGPYGRFFVVSWAVDEPALEQAA